MRLVRLETGAYGPLAPATLPMDGLVVLFGANSAGKTFALEQVADLMVNRSGRWDESTEDPHTPTGALYFQLEHVDVPGHPEADLYHQLLTHRQFRVSTESAGPPLELDEVWLRDMDTREALTAIFEALMLTGLVGEIDDERISFAEYCVQSTLLRFDGSEVCLAVPRPGDDGLLRAMDNLADSGALDDLLADLARTLQTQACAPLKQIGQLVDPARFFAGLLRVVWLDLNVDSIYPDVCRYLVQIHNRLWIIRRQPGFLRPVSQLFQPRGWFQQAPRPRSGPFEMDLDEDWGMDEIVGGDDWIGLPSSVPIVELVLGVDHDVLVGGESWLEQRQFGEEAQAVLNEWFRVKPRVVDVARRISERATELLPSFVDGRIDVEVLPPHLWVDHPTRVRITLDSGGREADLGVIGSGVARWVVAAIRMACHELANADVEVLNPTTGNPVEDYDRAHEIVNAAQADPLDAEVVRLKPSWQPPLIFIDEPEAHLHPAALRSVASWLLDQAKLGTVMVATHHPTLLNAVRSRSHVVLVSRPATGQSRLREVTESLHLALRGVALETGLSAADLLLLTRLVLFVEGPGDEMLLNGMFGDELDEAGVLIIPIFGTHNAEALVDSRIVNELGLPMAILTDDTSPSRVASNRPESPEEEAVLRLIRELRQIGAHAEVFGHSKRDIVGHLNEDVCRQRARDFPGWETAAREWRAAGRLGDFKRWVGDRYGLRLDRWSIFELARDCALQNKRSNSLHQRVRAITAYAAKDSAPT